jgi:hypothetical protein
LQAVNPLGDFLFKDAPIIPDDGKLKAAKAEELSKEIKQIDAQSRQKQEAQAREFEHNKQEVLKNLDASHSNSPSHQQLKNIFAENNPAVSLLREADKTGEPLTPQKLSERPLGKLTDQELAQRFADNQKEIQTIVGEAKLDIKNDAFNQKQRLQQQDELGHAQDDMQATAMDAFTYVGFTAGGDLLGKTQNYPWQKGLGRFDKSYTLYQNVPDLYKADKEGDGWKAGANAGDIALAFIPDKLADHNLVARNPIDSKVLGETEENLMKNAGKEFVDKAAASYAIGKGLIGLSAGGYSYYNLWKQNEQLDLLDNQRRDAISMNGKRLKELEEDQKQIKAEQDRRAALESAP